MVLQPVVVESWCPLALVVVALWPWRRVGRLPWLPPWRVGLQAQCLVALVPAEVVTAFVDPYWILLLVAPW